MNHKQDQSPEEDTYCSCKPLSKLAELGREASDLEARCDFLYGFLNLKEISMSDREMLIEYRDAARELNKAVRNYYFEITKMNLEGHLEQKAHQDKVTLNCVSCGKEIDVIA